MDFVCETSKESPQYPLVSVLVPSYNHEAYVIGCLESIKNLDYSRLELIVSDDCSSDRTFALAEQWASRNASRFERVLIIRQEDNLGIVRNLQSLFRLSHGEYLTYLASDDLLIGSAIESRLQALQKDPNIDAVFGNAQLISESGSLLNNEFIPNRISRELSSDILLLASLILNWCVPGPVMMIRRTAVLEGGSLGPLPDNLWAEDWYIYHRLAILGKLKYINEVVAKYRMVQSSMSQSTLHSKLRIKLLVEVDEKNRHLAKGVNRFLLETRLARWGLFLNRDSKILYIPRIIFWRTLIHLQRLALRCCSLALDSKGLFKKNEVSQRKC